MTTPTPTSTDSTQHARLTTAYSSFKHNAALTMLVVAPLLIAIPPRKLDLYTFSLTGAFIASINQLTVERTGRGLISQFGYEYSRNRPYTAAGQDGGRQRVLEVPDDVRRRGVSSTGKDGISVLAKDAWMVEETEGWKERRLREEQEKLNKGEGYGDMIVDQIWEVWNQGEKKEKDAEGEKKV